jgi:hypothetical protein
VAACTIPLAIRQLILGNASRIWPSVEGRIVESRVVRTSGGKGGTTWQPVVRFEYSVAGVSYSSSRIAFHMKGGTTALASASTADRYPMGATVRVYYDPATPGRAVLEVGSGPGNWLFLAITVGLTVAFVLVQRK